MYSLSSNCLCFLHMGRILAILRYRLMFCGVAMLAGRNMNKFFVKISSLAFIASALLVPFTTSAQTQTQRRDQTQNEWRNIALASGAIALLGVLKKDDKLTFAGAAGALYSLYRYDEDSKSKDRLARTRAEYFSRSEFYRDGIRYNRRTVTKGGKKYYQFYKAPKSQQDWKWKGEHDNRNNENSNRDHDKNKSNGKSQGKGKGK